MSFVLKKGLTIGDWINYSLLMVISLTCLFPFIYIISISFTSPSAYVPSSLLCCRRSGHSIPIATCSRQIVSKAHYRTRCLLRS